MAARHIGQYVSNDMAFFDAAGARLMAPQQITRESFGLMLGVAKDGQCLECSTTSNGSRIRGRESFRIDC